MLPGNSNRRRIFFVPLAYLFATRLQGRLGVLSWVCIYPVPILLSVTLFGHGQLESSSVLAVLLAMLATYGLYELGYMDNDVVTVRREAAPTHRLSSTEQGFYEERYAVIVGLRLLFVGVCALGVVLLVQANSAGEYLFLGGLAVIAIAFQIYNGTRGRINLPLQLVLVSARFCLPGAVAIYWGHVSYLLVMLLCFPLPNLLERSGEPRYRLVFLTMLHTHRHGFRVVYYLLLTLGFAALLQVGELDKAALLLAAYFLVYRTATFVVTLTRGGTDDGTEDGTETG